MYDLVIRNGNLIDGTGAPMRQRVDVAVDGDVIVAVGTDLGPGQQEIDAAGLLVTPGFIDLHTHYDGQVTWDQEMAPSSWHGVTTAVLGNCGVGFAPVHADKRDWVIGLMEGVEDIPGEVLAAGIRWDWETFPEYLDALDKLPRTIDIATQIAHGPVRAFVMGDRGARNEPATAEDIQNMARLVEEAMRAGALGFTTSRTRIHRSADGECVPGTFAEVDEMMGLGRGMARSGHGVFEIASDFAIGGLYGEFAHDFDWIADLAEETGVPIFYLLNQVDHGPDQWRTVLSRAETMNKERGIRLIAMTAVRPPGVIMSLQGSEHPFKKHPTYMAFDQYGHDELVAELRKPEVKARILAEETTYVDVPFYQAIAHGFDMFYPLGEEPEYEPDPQDSVAARAARENRDPAEYCYDLLLERDGNGTLFMAAADYTDRSLDSLYERLQRDDCVVSLSDAGAHARSICDASVTTYLLTHWARDRKRGPTLPLELVVRLQTLDTARLYGLLDRGQVASGYRADLNVIDFESLHLYEPRMVYDLPTGAPRLLQAVDGYVATIAGGQVTFQNGKPTGALPGKVIRGPQPAPALA